MPWDSVPWFVGGGAVHSTNVARLLAYTAFGGREGIIGPRDLEVREMSVPGPQVRIYPGACAILNRAANIKYEAYAAKLPTQDIIDIAPTGANERYDLIVAQVENPHIAGEPYPDPLDPAAGPYIFTRVIPGVGANTRSVKQVEPGTSAIALARLYLPASTGTVTQGRLTDLREMSQVREDREFAVIAPTVGDTLATTSFQYWPVGSAITVDIPEWATHLAALATIGGVTFGSSGNNAGAGWNTVGDVRFQLGSGANAVQGQTTRYNVSTESGYDRTTVIVGTPNLAIPTSMRGQTGTLRIEGNRIQGTTALRADEQSMIGIQVEWRQHPESNL